MKRAIIAIEVGCGVWLKSGGPPMTVVSLGNASASCMWFTEDEQGPVRDTFPLKCLDLIPEKMMTYSGK